MTQSKYCYKGTEVLINKLGIEDEETLNKEETKRVYERMVELELHPEKALETYKKYYPNKKIKKITKEHLFGIHIHMLQDVYPVTKDEAKQLGYKDNAIWLGKFREENISKGHFSFANAMFLESTLDYILQELNNEEFPEEKKALSKRLAYYLTELNIAHPFREGNGRSSREFLRQITLEKGFDIDWSLIKDKIVKATIVASIKDPSLLEEAIFEALVKK